MEELLNKIRSYDLFNNLLPGIIFAVIGENMTCWTFLHSELIFNLFLCYFYGIVISRIGSLLIEPIAKKLVTFSDYGDFIASEKSDPKLTILSEVNNSYRTLISLVICCSLLYWLSLAATTYPATKTRIEYGTLIALLVLFIIAYCKQINTIKKRVKENNKKENKE